MGILLRQGAFKCFSRKDYLTPSEGNNREQRMRWAISLELYEGNMEEGCRSVLF